MEVLMNSNPVGNQVSPQQHLMQLFAKELETRRNRYLWLAGAMCIGGIVAGAWVATRLSKVSPVSVEPLTIAQASVIPQAQPTDREVLISKLWQCQLTWASKIEHPELLTTNQLEQLYQQCLSARGGDI
jgi:hypothetical protein